MSLRNRSKICRLRLDSSMTSKTCGHKGAIIMGKIIASKRMRCWEHRSGRWWMKMRALKLHSHKLIMSFWRDLNTLRSRLRRIRCWGKMKESKNCLSKSKFKINELSSTKRKIPVWKIRCLGSRMFLTSLGKVRVKQQSRIPPFVKPLSLLWFSRSMARMTLWRDLQLLQPIAKDEETLLK